MGKLIIVLVAAFGSACAQVRPWERGAFAHFTMDSESMAKTGHEEFLQHVFEVREGGMEMIGSGGGCGCN